MENEALQTIDIRRILSLAPIIDEYSLGSDLILGEVSGKRVEKSEAILSMLKYPVRFDGYIIFFLRKGHFTIDLNLNTYEVKPNSLLMNVPGNIIKLSSYDEDHIGDAELYFVLASREFMSGIRFDFNKLFQESLTLWKNPCITLNEEDQALAQERRRRTDALLFGRGDEFARRGKVRVLAKFDLDENDVTPLPRDEVDLAGAAGKVRLYDPVAVPAQPARRALLAETAKLMSVHQCIFLKKLMRWMGEGPNSRIAA